MSRSPRASTLPSIVALAVIGVLLVSRRPRPVERTQSRSRERRWLVRMIFAALCTTIGMGSSIAVAATALAQGSVTERQADQEGDRADDVEAAAVTEAGEGRAGLWDFEMTERAYLAAQEEGQRLAAERAAHEAAVAAAIFPSDAWWHLIGQCEQPDGHGGVTWGTHGSNATTGVMFVGGLGIMEAAWNSYNVYGFPPGWLASPEQQMTIARDIFAKAGAGAWSCSKVVGPAF